MNTAGKPQLTDQPEFSTYLLDGKGGSSQETTGRLSRHTSGTRREGFVWHHLHRDHVETRNLLREAGLDTISINALMADDTRPRCTRHREGILLNLRGINLNPGSEPEDMISIRMWIEAHRVISVWIRPLIAFQDLAQSIDNNAAPVSPGDFVAKLALRLTDRAEPSIATLNEKIDDMEEAIIIDSPTIDTKILADTRRKAIVLRRYFIPQRDALSTLEIEDLPWLDSHDRARLREAAERVFRFGEELDSIRDRAQVIHDQIVEHRAERMSRNTLILSVVAAVFLPLSLITGLLGINVAGIPGADSPLAFPVVCGLIIAVAVGLVIWIRKLGMFD